MAWLTSSKLRSLGRATGETVVSRQPSADSAPDWRRAFEVSQAGLNFNDIIDTEFDDEFIFGFKVGARPRPLGIDMGRPSLWDSGGTVEIEGRESLHAVFVYFV